VIEDVVGEEGEEGAAVNQPEASARREEDREVDPLKVAEVALLRPEDNHQVFKADQYHGAGPRQQAQVSLRHLLLSLHRRLAQPLSTRAFRPSTKAWNASRRPKMRPNIL